MKLKLNLTIICLLLLCISTIYADESYALEQLPKNLISITSHEGVSLLKNDANGTTLKLLSNFTTQKTTTYCGVASLVMVLNSSGLTKPPDPSHKPYHYFTQEEIFDDQIKEIITPEVVLKKGIALTKLNQIVESFGLKSTVYYADELTLRDFRNILKKSLSDQQFVIVNFLRTGLNQIGGGHHSPLAAYDKKSDRFLMLDVARYKYPAYWVKTEDLYTATKTVDEGASRGFIVINQ